MAINLKELARLKEQIESDKKAKQRAEGRLEEMMSRLRKDHGCKTLEDAKRKSKELEKQERRLEKEYEQELVKLQKELWAHSEDTDDD